MSTLFVSDLHLDPDRPEITALFGRFLDGEARGADALYILGDLRSEEHTSELQSQR